jgi:hypothetical protein
MTNPLSPEPKVAEIIHDAMVWAAKQAGEPQRWQNGNSLAEGRAREAARAAIASIPTAQGWREALEYVRALTERTDISDGGKVVFIATKVCQALASDQTDYCGIVVTDE